MFGDSHNYHVNDIDAFFVQDELLEDIVTPAPTPEEVKVAELIVDRVNDGDCIQLGIGGIINAIAAGLDCKQHLGVFTEMFSDAFVQLQMKGVIDNSRKNYMPGVSVGGYSTGTQRLYDFINDNPDMYYCSYETVCNPVNIAQNDNLVSVNTAVSIDLTRAGLRRKHWSAPILCKRRSIRLCTWRKEFQKWTRFYCGYQCCSYQKG